MTTYISPDTTDLDECLDLLIQTMDACSEIHRSLNFPSLSKVTHGYTKSKKYTRVFNMENGVSKSVAFFVENATGDVWKAAGWKAPALNFTRGNILTKEGRAAVTIGKVQPSGYFYPGF